MTEIWSMVEEQQQFKNLLDRIKNRNIVLICGDITVNQE